MSTMFPDHRFHNALLPLVAALAFLAHVHYNKAVHSMGFTHHTFAASARGR